MELFVGNNEIFADFDDGSFAGMSQLNTSFKS
jgi:hypothetical protein